VKQFSPEQSVTLTMDRIAEEVAALPGVTGVAYTSTPPRSESDPRAQFTVPGREMVQAGDAPVASWRAVSANYFSVMRIPVSGRSCTAQDTFGKEPVIIVSASLAKRLFGGEDPLGKQILFFDEPRLVVGVAQDVLLSRTTSTVDAIYLPHAQSPR